MNYYNEFDPKAAAWLRRLIKEKLIPEGIVDERSITDVKPNDLVGFSQCHFFAGIAGWSLALQLANWPSDRAVWTGSCPCQAFSTAGKQLGFNDHRDLWPVFFRLIRECRPPVVFGEQVAAAIGHGWLDRLSSDLEREGYSVGSAVLGAFSVGAPHKRERLYWGAKLDYSVCPRNRGVAETKPCGNGADDGVSRETGSSDRELANSGEQRCERGSGSRGEGIRNAVVGCDAHCELADSNNERLEGRNGGSMQKLSRQCSPWSGSASILCRDFKYRRIPAQSGIQLLVDGIPYRVDAGGTRRIDQFPLCEKAAFQKSRVGLLKGFGNAIVPQVAAVFIESFQEPADALDSTAPRPCLGQGESPLREHATTPDSLGGAEFNKEKT